MSKKRLIPKLQMKFSERNPGKLVLVITKQFDNFIEIGDPVSQSKIYQDQGADELIFINIDRQNKSVQSLADIIEKVSQEIFMPITVGGGVQTIEDFRLLLSNGADKISINTSALERPEFISRASDKFGAQCVVVSIDYKYDLKSRKHFIFFNNGMKRVYMNPVEWAMECEKLGAGEILLTSIDHDGMKNGLELSVASEIAKNVSIPLILSGGCGLAQHFINGYQIAKADAVGAGSFFAQRDQNFIQTRSQIKNAGVEIRHHF